jgi:hypothetical protein
MLLAAMWLQLLAKSMHGAAQPEGRRRAALVEKAYSASSSSSFAGMM